MLAHAQLPKNSFHIYGNVYGNKNRVDSAVAYPIDSFYWKTTAGGDDVYHDVSHDDSHN